MWCMRCVKMRVWLHCPAMLAELLLKWPLLPQLRGDKDAAVSDQTRTLRRKNEDTAVARSICPYCGVGCVFHRQGRVVSIEGDPASPISRGALCPKGSASYELVTHPGRATKVKYRAPRSRSWVELDLESAVDMVADRMWTSRGRPRSRGEWPHARRRAKRTKTPCCGTRRKATMPWRMCHGEGRRTVA